MIRLNLETLGQKPGGEEGGQEKGEPPGCTSGVIPSLGMGLGREVRVEGGALGRGAAWARLISSRTACRLLVSAPLWSVVCWAPGCGALFPDDRREEAEEMRFPLSGPSEDVHASFCPCVARACTCKSTSVPAV